LHECLLLGFLLLVQLVDRGERIASPLETRWAWQVRLVNTSVTRIGVFDGFKLLRHDPTVPIWAHMVNSTKEGYCSYPRGLVE
jgi:hypothetical protein